MRLTILVLMYTTIDSSSNRYEIVYLSCSQLYFLLLLLKRVLKVNYQSRKSFLKFTKRYSDLYLWLTLVILMMLIFSCNKHWTNAVNFLEYVSSTYDSNSFSKLLLYPRYYKEMNNKSLKLNKSGEVNITG